MADDFFFELHSKNDLSAFLDAVLDYEERHIAGRFENIAYVKAYYYLKICMEEIIVNAFQHGYRDRSAPPRIRVGMHQVGDSIRAEVVDNANHFDPTAKAPATELGVLLGIDLVMKLVDEANYERLAGGNKVVLIKATD